MASPKPTRAYLPRLADTLLGSQLQAMGAVLIEGMKGCGKTATARQRAASEVLLDSDPNAARRAELDPRLLLDGDTPRLLDEWQRTPRLWDAVRRTVDDRGLPGQFILTGSATPKDDIPRHSGAGRFGIVRMRTMTLAEKQVTEPTTSVADLLHGIAPAPANSSRSPGRSDERPGSAVRRPAVGRGAYVDAERPGCPARG